MKSAIHELSEQEIGLVSGGLNLSGFLQTVLTSGADIVETVANNLAYDIENVGYNASKVLTSLANIK